MCHSSLFKFCRWLTQSHPVNFQVVQLNPVFVIHLNIQIHTKCIISKPSHPNNMYTSLTPFLSCRPWHFPMIIGQTMLKWMVLVPIIDPKRICRTTGKTSDTFCHWSFSTDNVPLLNTLWSLYLNFQLLRSVRYNTISQLF